MNTNIGPQHIKSARAESDATSRFKQLLAREDMTVGTIKDALLDVMKRDGQASWASVARHLAELRQVAGEFGRVRLDASIAHLRRLAGHDDRPTEV